MKCEVLLSSQFLFLFLKYYIFMTVFFYYGDEDYNIEQAILEKKSKLDKNFSAINFKEFDNPNFVDLISILKTQPMMFGKMLIVIKCLKYFAKAFEDYEIKEIEKSLAEVSESVDIVFVADLSNSESKKLDARKKFYKILSKYNPSEFAQFKSYEIDKISSWIKTKAKSKKITLDNDAIIALIEQIGVNLREFDRELDKLQLLVYPETKVTKKAVQEICISNEDLFTLTDFIMQGDKASALLELKKLFIKKTPMEILAPLQTMLHRFILIKLKSQTQSPLEISKVVGVHEFVVKKNIQAMKHHSLKDMVKLRENLIDAEYKIKSGNSIDIEGEIQNAIMR